MNLLDHALEYAAKGWAVFPCKLDKSPYTTHGHKDATTIRETITAWWTKWPDASIGWALPADIVVIDIDIKHDEGKYGDETMSDWVEQHGDMPETVISLTGGGGLQYFFTTDKPAKCTTNLLPSVDVRTKGGYVVLPPSNHPSGRCYEWEASSELGDVIMQPLPESFYQIMTAEKPRTSKDLPEQIADGTRNDTLFRLACSLRAKGLTEMEILAAISRANQDRCSTPLSDREISTLVHSAAKYEPGKLPTGDSSRALDWNAEIGTKALDETTEPFGTFATADTEWNIPIPFDSVETMAFPTESLPSPIEAFIEALAESTQTPAEMSAVLSLGVLATAFQGRYVVEVNSDWREPLCLYTAAIAMPGERKSAVISALTAPVYEYEAEMRDLEAEEIAQNKTAKDILQKALDVAKTNAGKSKSAEVRQKSRDEAMALSAELSEFKDMNPFRLVVDDTTSEKLVDIMDMQGGKITVASAEGGVFDAMAGRYDKNANFDVYLKGHAGDTISIDRIGRKANYIRNPRLTMMLTIQPDVLSGIMSNASMKGRGLCGRFLYAVCSSKVGRRNVNPDTIPVHVKEQYRQFVRHILSGDDSGAIRLSEEAAQLRLEYAEVIEKRLGSDWEHMRDWGGKAVGAMLRIAGLIHASETNNPCDVPMRGETISAAIKICECLGTHAMAAYQTMGADEVTADAKYLLKRIEGFDREQISKRDLFYACKSKFGRVENMDAPLTMLVGMGYVQLLEVKTGGRPSINVILNPTHKRNKSHKSL